MLTQYAEIEDLGHGQFRHTQHLKPICFLRNGSWVRDPFTLGDSGDANLTIGCSGISDFRIRNKLSGNAPVVHFGKGQSMVRFTPLDTNNVSGIAIGANGFKYPNAWNNADLVLTYGGHIVPKGVLLQAGHPTTFQFRIDEHAGLNVDTLQTPDFRILDPVLMSPDGITIEPLTWQKSTQGGKLILAVTIPANRAGWTLDPTLTLQPDASAGIDTTIYEFTPTINYGVTVTFTAGKSAIGNRLRLLLQDDLSLVPAGAIISSAVRTLYCTFEGVTTDYNVSLHRGLTQWYEGIRDGATPDATNGSTWNQRNANTGAPLAWGAAGGLSGTDYTGLATVTTSITGALASFDFDITADVVAWLANPAINFGNWGLGDEATNNSYKQFASSDNATAANRPKLVIIYTLPGGGIFQSSIMHSGIHGRTLVR